MGRVSLCLVIMFFICSAQKIDAQVQNIREKQDTISATKSLEHIRPENIKKGPLNNALDVLSGQSAGVNVTTNGTDRLAMLNSIRVRGTTSIMGGNDPLVIIDGVTSDIATLSTIYPADIESFTILKNATETAMYGSRGASGVIEIKTKYNPQNEMFRLLGTKRSFSQNETFFFSHPYPALFRLISHF